MSSIVSKEKIVLPNNEEYTYEQDYLYQIFRGDQLTVARTKSAIGIQHTHNTNKEKLHGIIPVVEDWHCHITLMQVHNTEFNLHTPNWSSESTVE